MSEAEAISTPARPKTAGTATNDRRALAQVEKWMATIREISREQVKEDVKN